MFSVVHPGVSVAVFSNSVGYRFCEDSIRPSQSFLTIFQRFPLMFDNSFPENSYDIQKVQFERKINKKKINVKSHSNLNFTLLCYHLKKKNTLYVFSNIFWILLTLQYTNQCKFNDNSLTLLHLHTQLLSFWLMPVSIGYLYFL